MSFLATLHNLFTGNEIIVVTVVAITLILFQMALVANVFFSKATVAPVDSNNVAMDDDEKTAVYPTPFASNGYDLWQAYAYRPWGF